VPQNDDPEIVTEQECSLDKTTKRPQRLLLLFISHAGSMSRKAKCVCAAAFQVKGSKYV